MLRYPTYMAVETLTIAMVTEDGQSFEDLGIVERKEGQIIIKCRTAEPMRDGAPCEFNKMGSDGYPFCASSTEVMRLREQNAELREQLAKARDPQRIGGTADPESFVYAIEQLREFRWQHATNDEEAIPYINNVADAHERENAKLRELCKDYHTFLALADLAQPIGHVIAASGHPTLSVESLDSRYRELGVDDV